MRNWLSLLLLFFLNSLHSQSHSVNEALQQCQQLNQKIENEPNEAIWIKDNSQLERLSKQFLQNNSISTSDKNKFIQFYSIALLNNGAYQTLTGKYKESIQSYKQSFQLAEKIKYYHGCASTLQNMGTSFDYLGKIDSSLVYFTKALHYAYQSKEPSTIAYVLTDLGYVNNNLGNNKIAIDYNLKALELFTQLKDDEGLERTHFAIGRIFDQLKDYEKSDEYYTKALEIARKNNNYQRVCLNLNSLANVKILQQKFTKAQSLLEECLQLCLKNDYTSISGVSYNLLGDIDFEQQHLAKAKENYLKAITIFKTDKNNFFLSKAHYKLAQIYVAENNLIKAEEFAVACYKLCVKNNYPSETRAISELLSEIYTKQKKYKEALNYKNIAFKISDSIYYDENKNTALKAEFKYNSSLKEAQIKALSQQKKIADLESQRQKNIALLLSILIISILISVYFLFNRYKINKQNEILKVQLNEAQKTIAAEKKATESELKALKSQMNPHFIFNALTSIQDQFMYGDKVLANEQMGNFTYLTRQILNVSGKKQILLATEIDLLTKYLELEKMRFTTDFEYEINLLGDIDEDYHEIPPMLIQPFVENSIKHGLLHKNGLKKIQIDFDLAKTEEYIICTVIDNGIGRQKSAEIKAKNHSTHLSFSTKAIEQRLELLNEKLQLPDLITYTDLISNENEVNGTKVVLKIPIV